jgi:predicted Zn-dependent protease
MSYHRYTAAFNQEPPNRPRLLERTVKQGISSTFHILDIPRCTPPTCVRAYPHTLVEHDQKTGELCRDCRRALALTLARSR